MTALISCPSCACVAGFCCCCFFQQTLRKACRGSTVVVSEEAVHRAHPPHPAPANVRNSKAGLGCKLGQSVPLVHPLKHVTQALHGCGIRNLGRPLAEALVLLLHSFLVAAPGCDATTVSHTSPSHMRADAIAILTATQGVQAHSGTPRMRAGPRSRRRA